MDFDDFDFSSVPIYDSLGYQDLTSGGKVTIQAWTKPERTIEGWPDISLSITWHDSEAAAKEFMAEWEKGQLVAKTGKRIKLPEEPVPDISLSHSDEAVAGFIRENDSKGLVSIRARYRNYFFSLGFAVSPVGYFPSIAAVVLLVVAFDEHVSKVLKENA